MDGRCGYVSPNVSVLMPVSERVGYGCIQGVDKGRAQEGYSSGRREVMWMKVKSNRAET